MNFIKDKRTFFAPDMPRGGGDDPDFDPMRYDRELAIVFKRALLANMPSPKNTENAKILSDMAKLLEERICSVGNNLSLIAPELRGLASAVQKLPNPEDRTNPHKLAMRFRNFDLSL